MEPFTKLFSSLSVMLFIVQVVIVHFMGKSCLRNMVVSVPQFMNWVVPLVGLPHVEMNLCISFVNLNWEVFCGDIAKQLGFETDKAKDVFRKDKDHHKEWCFRELMFYAGVDELLSLYVKSFATDVSLTGFWNRCQAQSPNLKYMANMCLNHLFAMMLFRVSVRRNCFEGIEMAMEQLEGLFFARHHPIYQRLLVYNRIVLQQMPDEMKDLLKVAYTTSVTGNPDSCLD
ncbi:uncharacterized protein [Clytia hemisphaerica]|uniref:uncharacterized protein n=1 Tax=Clytia hemisphaerica TaxID=252671 RepID=UPI0034D79395